MLPKIPVPSSQRRGVLEEFNKDQQMYGKTWGKGDDLQVSVKWHVEQCETGNNGALMSAVYCRKGSIASREASSHVHSKSRQFFIKCDLKGGIINWRTLCEFKEYCTNVFWRTTFTEQITSDAEVSLVENS